MTKDIHKAEVHSLHYDPVVIGNITPQIDHGQFSVKVIEGEVIVVQADIFSNGDASLAARIFHKHEKENTWEEVFLRLIGNDRWEGKILAEKTGVQTYFIKAWVDPLATWQSKMMKRVHQYLPVSDLLAEGVVHLEHMVRLASKQDQALIKEAIRVFKDKKRVDEAGQLAISYRFTEWLCRYPDSRLAVSTSEFNFHVYKKKLEFSSWYTMFPRSASEEEGRHGTFNDVVRLLPRIADMGFDVLHFPPIHPIGTENRRGKNGGVKVTAHDPGSCYSIGAETGGHDTLHPELGTIGDFHNLISEAGKLEIEIAMDLALQFSADHPWLKDHTDWFETNKEEPVSLVGGHNILPDSFEIRLNDQNWEAVKGKITEIIEVWADLGINIIRIVQPDHFPFDFWRQVITNVRNKYPELIFFAGTVTRPKVMDYLAKSAFALSDSYFMWRNSRYELEQYITELAYSDKRNFFKPLFRVNAPDVNPYNLQSGHEPQQLIRLFLAATLSGCYGIYGPVFEQLVFEAFPGKEEYWNAEKYEIKHWGWEKETKITYLIRMINRIRKENPALQQTNRIQICEVQNDQIMAYLKTDERGNAILSVVNLNAHQRQSGMVKVPLGLVNVNGDESYIANDLITNARYEWKGEWNYVELDPHILPFHVLKIVTDESDSGHF